MSSWLETVFFRAASSTLSPTLSRQREREFCASTRAVRAPAPAWAAGRRFSFPLPPAGGGEGEGGEFLVYELGEGFAEEGAYFGAGQEIAGLDGPQRLGREEPILGVIEGCRHEILERHRTLNPDLFDQSLLQRKAISHQSSSTFWQLELPITGYWQLVTGNSAPENSSGTPPPGEATSDSPRTAGRGRRSCELPPLRGCPDRCHRNRRRRC